MASHETAPDAADEEHAVAADEALPVADGAEAESELADEQPAIIRRVPRMEVFLALGAIVGLLATLVLTFSFPDGAPAANGATYTHAQTFGFLAIFLVPAGLGLGGLIGSLLGRRGARPVVLRRVDAPARTSPAAGEQEPEAGPPEDAAGPRG